MFNRKSTDNQQEIHSLKIALEQLKTDVEREKSRNRQQLTEFADLGEKMRRLYLRLTRLQKIESEQSSVNEHAAHNDHEELSPQEQREQIEKAFIF